MPDTTTSAATGYSPTLTDLADEWELSLHAANKSPATIKTYLAGVHQLAAFLAERGMPTTAAGVRREHVEAFLVHLLNTRSDSTAKTRHGGLVTFFRFLVDEGEAASSPLDRVRPPRVEERVVPVLSEDQLTALLRTVEGRGAGFTEARDAAIIRMFIDTGMRRSELAGLHLDDIDTTARVALVRVAKGRRQRHVYFGQKTAQALLRYQRHRARHPAAGLPNLWLGRSGPLGGAGVAQMIERRGLAAGIDGLHCHQFRHTAAHRWLAAGGSEGGLRNLAGWRNRAMLDRYANSVAADRARDEHQRLALGDQL